MIDANEWRFKVDWYYILTFHYPTFFFDRANIARDGPITTSLQVIQEFNHFLIVLIKRKINKDYYNNGAVIEYDNRNTYIYYLENNN